MLHPPTTNKLLHHCFFQPKNSRMSLQLYKLPSYPDSFKKMQSTYKKISNVIGEVTSGVSNMQETPGSQKYFVDFILFQVPIKKPQDSTV